MNISYHKALQIFNDWLRTGEITFTDRALAKDTFRMYWLSHETRERYYALTCDRFIDYIQHNWTEAEWMLEEAGLLSRVSDRPVAVTGDDEWGSR